MNTTFNDISSSSDPKDDNHDSLSITSASGVEIVAKTITASDIIDDAFGDDEAELSFTSNDYNDGEDEDTSSHTHGWINSMSFIETPRAGCKKVALVSLITLLFSFAVAGIVGVTKTRSNRIFSSSSLVVANAKSSKGPTSKSSKAPKAGGGGGEGYEFVGSGVCLDSQGRFFSEVGFDYDTNDPSFGFDYVAECATICDRCVKGSMVPEEAFRGYKPVEGCFCLFDLPLLGDNYDFSGSPCTPVQLDTSGDGTGPISGTTPGGPLCYRWVSG